MKKYIKIIKLISILVLNTISLKANSDFHDSEWTPLYQGVDYNLYSRDYPDALRIHTVRVNLENPDIKVATTEPENLQTIRPYTLGKKPSSFLREKSLQVAINAQPYSPAILQNEGERKWPEGLAIVNGIKYSEAGEEDATLITLKDGSVKIVRNEYLSKYKNQIDMAIGGWAVRGLTSLLVAEGSVPNDLIVDELSARTAIGISKDEKTLYLVVAEGSPRTGKFFHKDLISKGIYLSELGEFMKNLGCYYAINMDGGGASTLAIEDQGNSNRPLVINLPSDYNSSGERAVGSHFGIIAKPLDENTNRNFNKIRKEVLSIKHLRDEVNVNGMAERIHYLDTTKDYSDVNNYNNVCTLDNNCRENEYLDFLDLTVAGKKSSGKSKGGVYKDKDNVVWFVKTGQYPDIEYIVANLLNTITGDRSSRIKLVRGSSDGKIYSASRQITNFVASADLNTFITETTESQDDLTKVISYNLDDKSEIELSVVMDYMGMGDRHSGNLGYLTDKKTGKLIAARIDYDHSFVFEGNGMPSELESLFLVNPESTKHFTKSIINYGISNVLDVTKDIAQFPREQIEGSVAFTLSTLSHAFPSEFNRERYNNLSSALVQRKEMLFDLNKSLEFLNKFVSDSRNWKSYIREEVEYHSVKALGSAEGLLHYAASFNMTEFAEFLIVNYEYDINSKNIFGKSVIHIASEKDNEAFVRFLLDRDVDLSAVDHYERTPLYYAAKNGFRNLVQLFLNEISIDIEKQDSRGITALHAAIANGHYDVFKLLLDYGANIELKDGNMRSAIFYSIKKGRIDFFNELIRRGADINVADKNGFSPLHFSARTGYEHFSEALIKHHAKIDASDHLGRTPLYHAVSKSSLSSVILLVENGATLKNDSAGRNPIHTAVGSSNKNRAIAEFLIEYFDENNQNEEKSEKTKDVFNRNPLFLAAVKGHLDSLQLLIKKGIDPNVRDIQNRTPLHLAASSGNIDVVSFLCDHGANIHAKDNFRRTPIFNAANKNSSKIVQFLIDKGATKVNIKDKDDRTPLHFAARKGHADVVEVLIKNGADINAKDINGRGPIFDAVIHGDVSLVKSLISYGANPKALDKGGRSLLHFASNLGNKAMVLYLVDDLKLNVNIRDKVKKQTPLNKAKQKGHAEVVEILQRKETGKNFEKTQHISNLKKQSLVLASGEYTLVDDQGVVESFKIVPKKEFSSRLVSIRLNNSFIVDFDPAKLVPNKPYVGKFKGMIYSFDLEVIKHEKNMEVKLVKVTKTSPKEYLRKHI